MIFYNTVNVEDMNLSKAYNALEKKLPENFVNAYTLRATIKKALDDLDKHHDTNMALGRLMKNIDLQIKRPAKVIMK